MAEKNRLNALDASHAAPTSTRHHTYTRIVKKLRWALPAVAAFILAMLMIWPKIELEISERRFAPSRLDAEALKQAATENRLLDANFSSVDSEGRPFTINAEQAVQKSGDPDIILLKNPKGTLQNSATETMTGRADIGIYAQKMQRLKLDENVVLTRSDGTTLTTQTLFMDMMTNDAHTNMPVTIDGPQGRLDAQGMETTESGSVIIFPGPAKLIINSDSSIDPQGGS